MVVVSPNVDFGELTHPPMNPDQHLHGLKDAFDTHDSSMGTSSGVGPIREFENVDGDISEWESDAEILQPKATEDEVVPNGPDPVVPLILREPDAPIRRCRRSEVE